MLNKIANDMAELQAQLEWLKTNGYPEMTEKKLLIQTAKEGAQYQFDDVLEGPYWEVKWKVEDKVLEVFDMLGKPVGEITPRKGFATFSADFLANSALFWFELAKTAQRLAGNQ